jgi:hypothetical protein
MPGRFGIDTVVPGDDAGLGVWVEPDPLGALVTVTEALPATGAEDGALAARTVAVRVIFVPEVAVARTAARARISCGLEAAMAEMVQTAACASTQVANSGVAAAPLRLRVMVTPVASALVDSTVIA